MDGGQSNIFQLCQQVVANYRAYVHSFFKIRDSQIQAYVESEFQQNTFWPDALIQLNPAYARP